jgi:hypothetical protein
MARFCLMTKMSPGDYRSLTVLEYAAFVEAVREMNGVAE